MGRIECKLLLGLFFCTLWKSAYSSYGSGNTYDIPRWLRVHRNEIQCPEPTGQFNHPRYCDFFLNCWQGRGVVGRCHYGLVFNEAARACDYRSRVDCGGRPISDEIPEPVEAPAPQQPVGDPPVPPPPPADPRCPHPFGTFANPEDCAQYFVCQGGRATVRKCPQGMKYYNPDIGACDAQRPPRCPEIGPAEQQPIANEPISDTPNKPRPPATPIPILESSSPVSAVPSTAPTPPTSGKPSTETVPGPDIAEPQPIIAAGGTPTLAPTTKRPQSPYHPKPSLHPGLVPPFEETPAPPPPESESAEPQFTPKPPSQILEQPSTEAPSSTNPPQPDLSPKPPFVPAEPPKPPSQTLEQPPSTNSPQVDLSPKPPFVPAERPNPPAQILEPPPVTEAPPSTNAPQVDLSPKPPFVPSSTAKPPPQVPPITFWPKPVLVPEEAQNPSTENPETSSAVPPEMQEPTDTAHEQAPASEKPTGKPSTVSNLKPKPPLMPQPEEEDPQKPPFDLGNLKPKPPLRPPTAGGNPVDAPPPRPPPLNPGLFKPQRPPGAVNISTTTPAPVDGEDDPHILFPFLPKFPETFKCPVDTVMLPLLGDCSSLIACMAGVGHRLICPVGQTFSAAESRCTFPNGAQCPSEISNFIVGVDMRSPDIIYAYLPISKFSQLLKIDVA